MWKVDALANSSALLCSGPESKSVTKCGIVWTVGSVNNSVGGGARDDVLLGNDDPAKWLKGPEEFEQRNLEVCIDQLVEV